MKTMKIFRNKDFHFGLKGEMAFKTPFVSEELKLGNLIFDNSTFELSE